MQTAPPSKRPLRGKVIITEEQELVNKVREKQPLTPQEEKRLLLRLVEIHAEKM